MSKLASGEGSILESWEQRQKHAGFFQARIVAMQQSAVAAYASTTVVLPLAAVMAKFSDVNIGDDWLALYLGIATWGSAMMLLAFSFSRSATDIEAEYLEEHGALFPGFTPYRQHSFLLDIARKNPWLIR